MMTPRPERVSRHDVLSAAREIVDAQGLEQLTMRRLGTAIGADPMTAYRHFSGKAEIAAALADEFWVGLSLPSPAESADWRAYALALMRTIRSQLAAHPGLIPIVSTHPITSPAALTVADEAIGALLDLGAPVDPSLGDLVNVLVMVTVASAMGEFAAPAGTEPAEADAAHAEGNPAGHDDAEAELLAALPHLGRVVAAGWAPSAERQFEAGVAAIVHGWSFAPPATP
ncbi:TetR/AcrR family transcriptional regulator [Microbacterium sp. SSW1-49]|uniref:TetR/AcrR family transcriptional regulator n=1 Tax=Microbacterium croceum TaxID=2851645 RepID=A0ABT0FII0_9MICO|nr:TetR/AcrR family transcriptional regulator [Microbacterium croceum]MCK2037866.1 TetR/AcrR family transcriptional regulator [Microbacterium croceum]